MRTLLCIIIGLVMILTLGALASAADLMTPLIFTQGYVCIAANLSGKPIEIEITSCDDLEPPHSMSCHSEFLTVAPGDLVPVKFPASPRDGHFAMCKFSFQGRSDNVRASIMNVFPAEPIMVPAE